MIKMKTTFSRREQFWFGPLFALFGSMIGGIALWKFSAPEVAKWIWISSAVIIALYSLIPPLRKWIFMGWLGAVFPIGWVISHLLLGVVFARFTIRRYRRLNPVTAATMSNVEVFVVAVGCSSETICGRSRSPLPLNGARGVATARGWMGCSLGVRVVRASWVKGVEGGCEGDAISLDRHEAPPRSRGSCCRRTETRMLASRRPMEQ